MRWIFSPAALVAVGVLVVLASAPLWVSHVGLGAPPPLPPGARVRITGGHTVNVFDEGRGPAVVLIHGLPGSAHDWQPLPQHLVEAGYRVIRYDRVGYGRSTRRMEGEPHTIDANATDCWRSCRRSGSTRRLPSAGRTAARWPRRPPSPPKP